MSASLRADFSAVVDGDARVDRHEVYERLRHELPVFHSDRLDAWVVTRYDDVRGVLCDGERFRPPQDGAGATAFGRTFMQMSGREHNKKVGIVAREMRSPRALRERLDGLVRDLARDRAAGLPLGEPVELREEYAAWVPLHTITELLALPEAVRFRAWYQTIVAGGVSSIANPGAREAALVAREEVAAYLEPVIEERRRNPGDDLLSDLVTAEVEGAPIPHDEIVSNVIFLLAAGVETTERVLTSALGHLALDTTEWDWLCAHADDDAAVAAFSAEALRVYPPVNGNMRIALDDVDVGGTRIARGERALVLVVSANRDASRFADPHRFEHDRFAGSGDRQFTSAGEILPFGAGTHHCVGSRLAQVEMAHVFRELISRAARIEPCGALPPAEGFLFHSPPALPVVLHGPA